MTPTFYNVQYDFHNSRATSALGLKGQMLFRTQFAYTFDTFFHPFVGDLIAKLNQSSVQAMLDPTFLSSLNRDYKGMNFYTIMDFGGGSKYVANVSIPPAAIDTSTGGSYSIYNWELFYHIPVMIAVHLSQNQRFAERKTGFISYSTRRSLTPPAPRRRRTRSGSSSASANRIWSRTLLIS